MKRPVIANIPDATPETSFTEHTKVAKKKISAARKNAVRKSYSMATDDVSYIEKMALKLGQKRGKPVSESEALRTIINEHRSDQ